MIMCCSFRLRTDGFAVRVLNLTITVFFFLLPTGSISAGQQNQDNPNISSSVEIASIRDIGPLRFHESIRGRDGGFSTKFKRYVVMVFGDTVLNAPGDNGMNWLSNSFCRTCDFDAQDNLSDLTDPLNSNDITKHFLPFTENESAYNTEHFQPDVPGDKRSRYALWPGPVLVGPKGDKAMVFYSKLMVGNKGPFDFKLLGMSLTTWDNPDAEPIRHKIRTKSEDPTILFPEDDVKIGHGAMVVGDWIYAYGSETKKDANGVSWPCIVGRVKFDMALERESWRFYAGNGRWSSDFNDAVTIMDAAPALSVHWNEYLGKYIAVYSSQFINKITIRTAFKPEGPWSSPIVAVDCLAPTTKQAWSYCGMAHPAFAKEKGRIEYFTYCREIDILKGEVRLVQVTFK
ncbi:MAG: DUF4185 domain-containing protein [Planctomycetota bacterium]